MALRPGRAASFGIVVAVYVVASAAAVGVGLLQRTAHPILVAALADLAATVVVFAASLWLDNSSTYDPYWSVAPIPIAGYWMLLTPQGSSGVLLRQLIVLTLVCWWGLRLTMNWARGWSGLDHEDWRYEDFRRKTGRLYWLVSFAGIHLFPTVQVFAGCLALWPALTGSGPLGALDVAGAIVTLGAICIEAIADRQLRAFVTGPKRPGEVLERGLWSWSRHPNYFGEMMFWWGLALFGLAGNSAAWWAVSGAVAITVMFRFVSIPMMEKRMLERRPAFEQVCRRVSMLLPLPPKRG
ncbi:MAG: DUF1295 domain-containing protein [Polyangiaceae bacterium]|nr:DUF1295 domain-containing protein [Polyangiaceae bacterium]